MGMTNPNGGELGIDALVQPDATVAPLQCLVINQEQCNTIDFSTKAFPASEL
jgi:hypothetical protein